MVEDIPIFLGFAICYAVFFSLYMHFLIDLSNKDCESRYADPDVWRGVRWVVLLLGGMTWIIVGTIHPGWLLASGFWIVMTYCAAKLPKRKWLGGHDARILMSAGFLFPHWLTIPSAFVIGMVLAALKRKTLNEEQRAEWRSRGIPMVPYLTVGMVGSADVFLLMLFFF